jgi:acyl-CoA thioesterase-1
MEYVQRLGLVLILTVIFASSTNVSATGTDTRKIIVCFGDSLTAGYGVDPDLSYPAAMQRDLDVKGYKYRVVNMGVSGETTKDGLARVGRVLAL